METFLIDELHFLFQKLVLEVVSSLHLFRHWKNSKSKNSKKKNRKKKKLERKISTVSGNRVIPNIDGLGKSAIWEIDQFGKTANFGN